MPAPILVFAVGNESRGDDALGPLLLRELVARFSANKPAEEIELLEDFQLQIEHAMDMKDRRRVLFIDAGMDTAAPFSFYRAQADDGAVLYSHALTPPALLKVYTQFYQEPPPEAYILCVRGSSFELGAGLSDAATGNLQLALEFVEEKLRQTADWENHKH